MKKTDISNKSTMDLSIAERALALLDSETADSIIGESTDELQLLEQGAQTVLTMLWGIMQGCGILNKTRALEAVAKAILMEATLVHYAYALGLKRGREEAGAE